MKPVLSAETLLVKIPANLLEVSAGLSAQAVRLILGYYQLMAAQENEAQLCLNFDLRDSLPGFSEEAGFDQALEELKQAGLMLCYPNPEIPEQIYLIPGTEQGKALLLNLEERPQLLQELKNLRFTPGCPSHGLQAYEENIGPLTPIPRSSCAMLPKLILKSGSRKRSKAVHYNAFLALCAGHPAQLERKRTKRSNEEDKRDHESFRKLYLDQKEEQASEAAPQYKSVVGTAYGSGDPDCPICHGIGYVGYVVPIDDPCSGVLKFADAGSAGSIQNRRCCISSATLARLVT